MKLVAQLEETRFLAQRENAVRAHSVQRLLRGGEFRVAFEQLGQEATLRRLAIRLCA